MRTIAILAALALGSCQRPNAQDHAAPQAAGALPTRPLKGIMVTLGQDMNRLSDGIWRDDLFMIERAARDIADHPRVTPDEMARIQGGLGDAFPAFVQFDAQVHEIATGMASAAERGEAAAILEAHPRLQAGCVGCHTAFRSQVREALLARP